MLSIEIFRNHRNLSVSELVTRAGINKQTYYNMLAGDSNISQSVFDKLDQVLCTDGWLPVGHYLDRLHQSGITIKNMFFPKSLPVDFGILLRDKHPVFSNSLNIIDSADKYNLKVN